LKFCAVHFSTAISSLLKFKRFTFKVCLTIEKIELDMSSDF